MGPIIASYEVRITLREADDLVEGQEPTKAPTNSDLEEAITQAIEMDFGVAVKAASQRVDA